MSIAIADELHQVIRAIHEVAREGDEIVEHLDLNPPTLGITRGYKGVSITRTSPGNYRVELWQDGRGRVYDGDIRKVREVLRAL